MRPTKLSKLLQYGLIAFPLAFAGLPIYLHAPDFYATGLSIPLELIGAALLLMRFIDAVQDPLIGDLSDRFHQHRSKIVVLGALMLAGGMWMIFHPYEPSPLIWLCFSVLICTTGFSIVTINVQAAGGLWKVPDEDVTKVMGAREAMGLCGLLVASITPPILLMSFEPQQAYALLTYGFFPLIVLCLLVFLAWIKSVELGKPEREVPIPFKEVFHGSRVRLFFLGYFLSSVAAAIPGTLIIFYVRDYLQAESYLGLFLLIYFLSGAAALPLWIKLAKHTSTLKSWWISMVLAVLTFIWAFTLNAGDIVGYAIVCLTSGIAVGANLAMPSAIAANILSDKDHHRAASRYYSLMAFIAKGSLAMATGIALPLLGLSGYQPGEITSGALMPTAYALVPCIIQIFAILILWRLVQMEKSSIENARIDIA
ncbi:MAG: MFS transporter [Gammaproteobacteria bacterium]|nr:MFS transporter [Gammaproteobacteria bacterium]